MNLKITTINTRSGLNDYHKRMEINERCKIHGFDIIFLQELKINDINKVKQLERNWKGKLFCSYTDNINSNKGVGIFIYNNIRSKYKIINKKTDFEGRIICLDIDINGTSLRLLNIYAPNDTTQRKLFLVQLETFFLTSRHIIAGGDWNFVEDPIKDKQGGDRSVSAHSLIGKNEIQNIKSNYKVTDVYRWKHPKWTEYTWRQVNPPVFCRLDRFYISNAILPKVRTVSINNCTVSDHLFVDLVLEPFANKTFGPGYWKLNDSILKDKQVISEIKNLWDHKLSKATVKDHLWWEFCKREFKKCLIKNSKRIANQTKKEIAYLEEQLSIFSAKATSPVNPNKEIDQICANQIQVELKTFLQKQMEGARIRSKAKSLDNAEKPSKYFFRLEQKRQDANLINELYDPQTKTTTKDPNRICQLASNFYAELFKYEPVQDSEIDYFLENINFPRLQPHLVEACEGDLTLFEAKQALFQMENDHSPGADGLTAAFYKKFFSLFGQDFTNMINHCRKDVHKLPESQRLGLIRLICKDIAHAIELMFYRPISLINYDYKIVAKILANRLKYVLKDIISVDQTCSIPGRTIFDNVHLMRDIFEFSEHKQIECAVLSLDKVKAFDRVSHHYMYRVLKKFGFGPDFIEWVQLLYNDIESSVIINGLITKSFKVQRSVRQGCPLSMCLYVCQSEPFAIKIRANPQIKGLQLRENAEAKISEYADDTNIIVTTIFSVHQSLIEAKHFENASGAKLNLTKTCIMGLGKWKNRTFNIPHIQQVDNLKTLGLRLGHSVSNTMVWGSVHSKYIKSYNAIQTRELGMRGKAVLSNVLSCSKLWYLASVITLPKNYLREFNTAQLSFIWDNKPYMPIKKETLCLPPKKGGIGLVNIELKDQALKIFVIVKLILISDYIPKWAYFAIYYVGMELREYRPDFASNTMPHSFEFRPQFYTEAIKYFKQFMLNNNDIDFEDLSVKMIYEKLIENQKIIPKIQQHFPDRDYEHIYRNINNPFLDFVQRDVLYKLVHKGLPFRETMGKYNVFIDQKCKICKSNVLESPAHVFARCKIAQDTWPIIKELFLNLCNHRLKINFKMLLEGDIPKEYRKNKFRNKYLYLTSLAIQIMYRFRCKIDLKNASLNSQDLKNSIIYSFKERLKIDFHRLGHDKFISMWGKHNTLYRLNNSMIIFDF